MNMPVRNRSTPMRTQRIDHKQLHIELKKSNLLMGHEKLMGESSQREAYDTVDTKLNRS